jgi:MFS family permease
MPKARPAPYSQSALYGWTAVMILVIAYAVSVVDRQVVGLLVEPLRRDLAITDTQIGVLQGPAFGLFFAIAGLPLGWLADRVHRVRLVAVGILLWSVMTIASGLANSFGELFVARMGVGVGEAALVPAAVSLLADFFRPERRALPMAVFTAGTSLGNGLALMLGGAFVAYAAHGVRTLPLLGPWLAAQHGWQAVFVLAGLLGAPVGLAVLLLAEPSRTRAGAADSPPKTAETLAFLRAHWRLFVPLLAGPGLMYLCTNALAAWAPTLFIRKFHWLPSEVGIKLGILVMPSAVAGSVLSGLVATWITRRGGIDGPLRTMLIGAGLLLPLSILGPLAPTSVLALVGIVGMYFSIALCFGVATATFVAVTPSRLRGQMVALYLLIANFIGLGLGPVVVGALLDHLRGGPGRIGVALAIVGAISIVPGVLLLGLAKVRYAGQARAIEGASREADALT